MGRIKGYIVSEETKAKRRETLRQKKEGTYIKKKKKEIPKQQIILVLTGKEKTGFDFWPILRKAFRPAHLYSLCKKLEEQVTKPEIWQNPHAIISFLETYAMIRYLKGGAT